MKLMVEFDDEEGLEYDIKKEIDRISAMDFLLFTAGFADTKYVNKELYDIKNECTKKVFSILKKVDLELINFYEVDDKNKILKYEIEEKEED